MSRRFGILALVFAFAWSGFILWRMASPRLPQITPLPERPKPVANLDAVRRDLCSLAHAELNFQHSTGHYATMKELLSNGDPFLNETRWPYRYVLHVPDRNVFVITAVAEIPVQNQPRILTIDAQLQIQTRTRPPRIYPCDTPILTQTK